MCCAAASTCTGPQTAGRAGNRSPIGTPTGAAPTTHTPTTTPWSCRRPSPAWVYDLNDGGMDFSSDGGATWENRSNGLATNMFYDLAVAQTNGQVIAGGAQDNGTLITPDGQPDTYFEMTGGDGGWVVIDPTDA